MANGTETDSDRPIGTAQAPEIDALAKRLQGVIRAHEACARDVTVDVNEDRSGTLHYPCGATITDARGLVEADQRHLAAALAREAMHHVYPPGRNGGR